MTAINYGVRPKMQTFGSFPAGAHVMFMGVAYIKIRETNTVGQDSYEKRNAVSYRGDLIYITPSSNVEHVKRVNLEYENDFEKVQDCGS